MFNKQCNIQCSISTETFNVPYLKYDGIGELLYIDELGQVFYHICQFIVEQEGAFASHTGGSCPLHLHIWLIAACGKNKRVCHLPVKALLLPSRQIVPQVLATYFCSWGRPCRPDQTLDKWYSAFVTESFGPLDLWHLQCRLLLACQLMSWRTRLWGTRRPHTALGQHSDLVTADWRRGCLPVSDQT